MPRIIKSSNYKWLLSLPFGTINNKHKKRKFNIALFLLCLPFDDLILPSKHASSLSRLDYLSCSLVLYSSKQPVICINVFYFDRNQGVDMVFRAINQHRQVIR